jgi:hypothetical protein
MFSILIRLPYQAVVTPGVGGAAGSTKYKQLRAWDGTNAAGVVSQRAQVYSSLCFVHFFALLVKVDLLLHRLAFLTLINPLLLHRMCTAIASKARDCHRSPSHLRA